MKKVFGWILTISGAVLCVLGGICELVPLTTKSIEFGVRVFMLISYAHLAAGGFMMFRAGLRMKRNSIAEKAAAEPTQAQQMQDSDSPEAAMQEEPVQQEKQADDARIVQQEKEKQAHLMRVANYKNKISVQTAWNTFLPEQQECFEEAVYQYSQDVHRGGTEPEIAAASRGLVLVDGRAVPEEVARRLEKMRQAAAKGRGICVACGRPLRPFHYYRDNGCSTYCEECGKSYQACYAAPYKTIELMFEGIQYEGSRLAVEIENWPSLERSRLIWSGWYDRCGTEEKIDLPANYLAEHTAEEFIDEYIKKENAAVKNLNCRAGEGFLNEIKTKLEESGVLKKGTKQKRGTELFTLEHSWGGRAEHGEQKIRLEYQDGVYTFTFSCREWNDAGEESVLQKDLSRCIARLHAADFKRWAVSGFLFHAETLFGMDTSLSNKLKNEKAFTDLFTPPYGRCREEKAGRVYWSNWRDPAEHICIWFEKKDGVWHALSDVNLEYVQIRKDTPLPGAKDKDIARCLEREAGIYINHSDIENWILRD